jgi:predicted AlkP superfamily phosphohydrolase/phosphomutase/SAM-dependent methyltransferase
MRAHVRQFIASAARWFEFKPPIYEFGSFQVAGQERLGDLRPLFPGARYVGCDLRPGPGVDRIEDVMNLSLADDSAPSLICVETLEHVFDPRRAIDEMIRVLAPGGVLLISTPFYFHIHEHPHDYWRITPDCLARLLEPLAGRVIGYQGTATTPHTVYGIGVKDPAPADFSQRAERFIDHFQGELRRAAASIPWKARWHARLRGLRRGKGERRRAREYFNCHFSTRADRAGWSSVAAPTSPPRQDAPTSQDPFLKQARATASRVLVIGLDGATYDLLAPLAHLGIMPNVARLLRDSALGMLRSTSPCITPAAWTTFQTGVDPLRHGIVDFRYYDHHRRAVLLNSTTRLLAPTLYDCVHADGGEVVSLGVPMTWPGPSPRGDGVIVGGIDSPSPQTTLARYPALARRLERHGLALDYDLVWHRKPRTFEELCDCARRTEDGFAVQGQLALGADAACDWRFMVVQFQVLDALLHRCWHLLGIHSQAPDGATSSWTRRIHQVFTKLDDIVGQLLDLAERRRAACLVLSDHGFGAFREKISVREILRRRQLLVPAAAGARLGYRIVRSAWKLRRTVAKFGAGPAQIGRPLASLASIDWRRTRVVALHGALAGLCYVVRPQRFGRGPVHRAADYDQTMADLAAAFEEARHPETDEPLFTRTIAVARHLNDDPLERCLPDLVAIPADGFHTRVKPDHHPRLMPADPEMTGTHRMEGVLMIQAPGVRTGHPQHAHIRDVAPTILKLLGIAAPDSMQGRPLDELFDGLPCESNVSRLPASAEAVHSSDAPAADAEQVEARLRRLGYVD